MQPLRIDVAQMLAAAAAGDPMDLPAGRSIGLDAADVLTALTAAAVRESASDLELLQSVPVRDETQFGDRPAPAGVDRLGAWLYSASARVAYAVHTPDWTAPTTDPERWTGPAGWTALLHQHLHGDFHAGRGWTPVNAVAMPVRRPFDEPGLRIRPLLSLWSPVSQHGDEWFSETMTASVREGRPHVVAVQVFSAAAYLRRLAADGQRRFELTGTDRRLTLVSSSGW